MNDLIKSMISNAKQALNHAYAPYSHYSVASCLCTEDGSLYTGVNVENTSYGLSICAEASAICHMIAAGKQKIKTLVILNGENTICPPCGACRQRLMEFSMKDMVIHLCDEQTILKSLTLDELLPYPFRFKP